jgi:hypothetical protein
MILILKNNDVHKISKVSIKDKVLFKYSCWKHSDPEKSNEEEKWNK